MSKKRQLSESELSALCEQLYMIITSGLPAYQGISLLLDAAEDSATRELLQEIYTPMEEGGSLHAALEHTGVFPNYMIHMLEIGEETGRLEEVLKSLADYYDREAKLKSALMHAVRYPIFMFFMMFTVIIVLITKVLPVFSDIYEELGSTLTGTAQVLMDISIVLNRYLIVFILAIIVLILIFFFVYRSGRAEMLFQKKPLFIKIASSRFANCMYLTVASGLDGERGLELASQINTNPIIGERIRKCRELLTGGALLSDALFLSDIFPKMYSSWIQIGYTTGEIDLVLKRICDSYEEETDDLISHRIALLEPTLVIILSVVVGLILVSFLLPLLGILSSIG